MFKIIYTLEYRLTVDNLVRETKRKERDGERRTETRKSDSHPTDVDSAGWGGTDFVY